MFRNNYDIARDYILVNLAESLLEKQLYSTTQHS